MRTLNNKELSILTFIAKGLTDIEIGIKLNTSPRYVRRIIENLFNKTGAINKASLVSWGYENKVLGGIK